MGLVPCYPHADRAQVDADFDLARHGLVVRSGVEALVQILNWSLTPILTNSQSIFNC